MTHHIMARAENQSFLPRSMNISIIRLPNEYCTVDPILDRF
jgi:hypothetical protein